MFAGAIFDEQMEDQREAIHGDAPEKSVEYLYHSNRDLGIPMCTRVYEWNIPERAQIQEANHRWHTIIALHRNAFIARRRLMQGSKHGSTLCQDGDKL